MIAGGADENTLFTIQGLDKTKYEIDLITGEEVDKNILNEEKNHPFNIIQIKGLKWKLNFFHDPIVLLKLIKFGLNLKAYQQMKLHFGKVIIPPKILQDFSKQKKVRMLMLKEQYTIISS